MRGVGGPLLTVSDLLSDLAADAGDDRLGGSGDASVPSTPMAAPQVEEADPSDLSGIFEKHYDNLLKSLRDNDPSWPSLMLKLCKALNTSDKLVDCANGKAEELLDKLTALEHLLQRGDAAMQAIIETLKSSNRTEADETSTSKLLSK